MEDLQNKDISILTIWSTIVKEFENNIFTLVNFWDDDNYSLGFKKGKKLIYVSTWHFQEYLNEKIMCYCEFTIIDEITFDTEKVIKEMDCISLNTLIIEIHSFLIKDDMKNM